MLQHEQAMTDESAARVRVSSHELVEAIAEIEATRQTAPDGITLGEAVQQLGLDISPEELLRAIRAREERQAAAQRQYAARVRRLRRLGKAIAVGAAAAVLAGLMMTRMLVAPHMLRVMPTEVAAQNIGTDFGGALQAVNANGFDDGKLATVKMLTHTRRFTTDEARQILQAFSFDAGRVEAAEALYPVVTDPQNFFRVLDAFSFDQGRKDVIQRLHLD